MRRLARFVILRRWFVIGGSVLGVLAAGAIGGAWPIACPSAASATRAAGVLDEEFAAGTADIVLVVTADAGDVDADQASAAGLALTEAIAAEPGVAAVTSHWAIGLGELSPLRSTDGRQALLIASLEGDDDEVVDRSGELSEAYTGERDGLVVAVTGLGEVTRQVSELSESDLRRAETLSMPIIFFALIVVFGSLVAAFLPLLVGIVAVIGTFLVLTLLTGFTDVSVFALNVTTAMGLGLGIDYSLFIVSRYREEAALGHSMEVALSHAMQTAGRTVAFSAATVAVSLAALGPRVEKGKLFDRKTHSTGTGFWHRQAERVMAHPWPYAIGVTAVLLALAVPFLSLETGTVDDRVLPESASSRAALDDLRADFDGRETSALTVVLPDGADDAALDAFAAALSSVADVVRVDGRTGSYQNGEQLAPAELLPDALLTRFESEGDATWLSVVPGVEPVSAEAERLVENLRAVAGPGGRS